MPTKSYLTLGLFNSKYGIEAELVREIFPLPELRPIPEMPGDVIGVLNLRGTIIPVMHLAKRLGLPLHQCHLSDSVIVIEWEEVLMGLIVHDTYEVISLDEAEIGAEPQYGRLAHINTAFLGGIATVDGELISLIAAKPLIREPDKVAEVVAAEAETSLLRDANQPQSAVEDKAVDASEGEDADIDSSMDFGGLDTGLESFGDFGSFDDLDGDTDPPPSASDDTIAVDAGEIEASTGAGSEDTSAEGAEGFDAAADIVEPGDNELGDFFERYCPNVTPADRAIFQLRAENLRQQLDESISDTRERMPLAIVGLNDEYFGIELSAVKEFITVGTVTNIPCCPRHIVGSTNLRGEILVLVDVRSALNLSAGSASDEDGVGQAVVVEVDDLVAGILVDEIYDVDYVPSTNIASVPSNISDAALEYFKGTLPFKQRMLSILDMPKLISSGRFVVDEVV